MPTDALPFALLVLTSLLAIVDPVGAVPIYLSVTAGYDRAHRRAVLRVAIVTAIVVLVLFAFVGTWILHFFGVTANAFRITGGLIFLALGSDMLQARHARDKTTKEEEREAGRTSEVGVIPLGIPMLAGPGAMSNVITLVAQGTRPWQRGVVVGAIVAVMLVTWVVLALAPTILRRFGQTGLNVLTRVMGLIVMVIGTQFIIDGVRAVVVETARAP